MKKIGIIVFVLIALIVSSIQTAFAILPFQELNDVAGGGGSSSPVYTLSVTIFAIDSTGGTSSSSGSSGYTVGHVWLEITNNHDSSVNIGKMNVSPFGKVTIGTWGNEPNHVGLFYNLEVMKEKSDPNKYNGRVSYTESVSISAWNAINNYVIGYDKWSLDDNCSDFASNVWNLVCNNKFDNSDPFTTPSYIANRIRLLNYKTNYRMGGNISQVGYYQYLTNDFISI